MIKQTIFLKRLYLVILALFFLLLPIQAFSATYVVDGSGGGDFLTIQSALNASSNSDTILVASGVYTENLDVDKQVIIKSINGNSDVTVIAQDSEDHVFHIISDKVTVQGFSVYGAGGEIFSNFAGIYLDGVANCRISENYCGIDASRHNRLGIVLDASSYNIISNNICCSNYSDGICAFFGSSNNSITGNVCNNNDLAGIEVEDASTKNTVLNNTCSHNLYGIWVNGSSNENIISGNICDSNDEYGIMLHARSGSCESNIVTHNTISNNQYGVFVEGSVNNILYFNNIENNHTANTHHSYWAAGDDKWFSNYSIKYFYNDMIHESYLGNYYSDYISITHGNDNDDDGIGSEFYPIGSLSDLYPLWDTTDNFVVIGDLDNDIDIDGSDLSTFAALINNSSSTCDLNRDGVFNFSDIALFAHNFGRF